MKDFNYRLIARLTGTLLMLMAVALALPTAVSLYLHDGAHYALLLSAATTGAFGLMLRYLPGRNAMYVMRERESFWITSIIWITIPLFGTLP